MVLGEVVGKECAKVGPAAETKRPSPHQFTVLIIVVGATYDESIKMHSCHMNVFVRAMYFTY